MRKFLIAAFAATGLVLGSVSFADEHEKEGKKKEGVTGIIIDAKCGAGKKAKEVADHPASCVLKCAETGIGVLQGDKWIKFDDKGQELAKKYLEEAESAENKGKADDAKDKKTTRVRVVGKVSEDGKTIAVKEIRPAPKKADKKES